MENETVVVSIFVNPTQFGPKEDFTTYPRDIPRDLAVLEKEKTDIVFLPQASEVYPQGFDTWIEVGKVGKRLEGADRPGHFRGVATVVNKLFNIVGPDKAYFGQKDAQQYVVIKRMVSDLNMNVEVIIIPTLREPNGLAMSSRNVYLSTEERRQSAVLYEALKLTQNLFNTGEREAGRIKREMEAKIRTMPLADIQYISVANAETLEELEKIEPPALVSLAVKFGKTRLIDNIMLE